VSWDTPLPPGADPSTPVCRACKKRRASCFEFRRGADPESPQLCAPCYLARWQAEMDQVQAEIERAAEDAEEES
jgi:hypothetical protein